MNWCVASASSTGTSHLSKGIECQDASSFAFIESVCKKQKTLLAVLSDGAGNSKQAARASRLVCRYLINCAEHWLKKSHQIDLSGLLLHSAGYARQALVRVASSEGVSISEFSATCLCLLIKEDFFAALQVGDGLIIIENPARSISPLFWPCRYEYANTTTFLTSRNWHQDLQYAQWSAPISFFFLCSDGIQSICSYSQLMTVVPGFTDAFKRVLRGEQQGYSKPASKKILAFLESDQVSSRTDDDKTVLIGIND